MGKKKVWKSCLFYKQYICSAVPVLQEILKLQLFHCYPNQLKFGIKRNVFSECKTLLLIDNSIFFAQNQESIRNF